MNKINKNKIFPFGYSLAEKKLFKVFAYFLIPLLFIVFWSVFANYLDKPYIIPTPKDTFYLFLSPCESLLSQGSLWSNTIVSLLRILIGFTLSMMIAIPTGLIVGGFIPLRKILEPFIEFLRPISPIAWLPFVIVIFKLTTIPEIFGFGYTKTVLDQLQIGMIFIVFLGGFYPIFINTLDSVMGVKENYIRLAVMQGANKKQILTKVVFPSALPRIFTGVREGIGMSWRVIIAAEMLPGSNAGIGYLLVYAADMSAMNIVLATIIIIGGIGIVFNYGMVFISHKFLFWQGREE